MSVEEDWVEVPRAAYPSDHGATLGGELMYYLDMGWAVVANAADDARAWAAWEGPLFWHPLAWGYWNTRLLEERKSSRLAKAGENRYIEDMYY